jgi:hypothetical protein
VENTTAAIAVVLQEIRRTRRTEQATGATAGCTHIRTLAMLHENKDDDRHCGKEVYNPNKRLNVPYYINFPAAWQIILNDPASRDAPPTRAPSTFSVFRIDSAFSAFTLPP